MDARGKDGLPRRVHLESAAEGLVQTADSIAAQAELDAEIPLPNIMADVWVHFSQLNLRRGYTMEGDPMRFTWGEIKDYMEVTEVRLGRWYLKTIFALEDEFFKVRAENKS